MEELREKLLRYKELTDNIISSVIEEKEENFKNLIIEKQLLINSIEHSLNDKAMFKEIAEELCLMDQDKKLNEVIEEKKLYIKSEIRHLDEKKNANRAYNNAYRGYNIINKQI
jgi:hypothetical protein